MIFHLAAAAGAAAAGAAAAGAAAAGAAAAGAAAAGAAPIGGAEASALSNLQSQTVYLHPSPLWNLPISCLQYQHAIRIPPALFVMIALFLSLSCSTCIYFVSLFFFSIRVNPFRELISQWGQWDLNHI
jgi:hypothetical protein